MKCGNLLSTTFLNIPTLPAYNKLTTYEGFIMYILIGILFAICILFFIIKFFRKKYVIRKICHMGFCDKLNLFNDLAKPFGFCYLPGPDTITSRRDAWQKNFGYRRLFDQSASRFNMIFDCEPIYFDYDGHTWMIELWKGQYGINIGSEIGIYKADSILRPQQYDRALFHCISDDEMLPLWMELNFKGRQLFSVNFTHWWLTGFCIGSYCEPEDLSMDVAITFPNEDMLECFLESLERLGYTQCDLCVCELTVSFNFSIPHTKQPRQNHRCRIRFSQWKNRIFCKLYQFITRPFTCTMEKILYLYFFLPAAFRHIICFKRNRRQKFKKCNPISKRKCRKCK